MLLLIVKIFPLALGEMISPVVLSVMLVILSGKKAPLSRALSFLIGMGIAVALLGVIGLNLNNGLAEAKHANLTFWSDLILVVLSLALGIRTIFKKPKEQRKEENASVENAQNFARNGQKNLRPPPLRHHPLR